jgi:hypothetical protein
LLIVLITLTALLGIGAVTMLSVRSETQSAGEDRFEQLSLYAAESGAAMGMEFLRLNCNFNLVVSPSNSAPVSPAAILGNFAPPGDPANVFAPELQSWYTVTILNNENDSGFTAGTDNDRDLILQVVGHGPNQAQSTIQVEISDAACGAPFVISGWREL